MRVLSFLEKPLLPICVLAVFLCLGVQSISSRPTAPQQTSPPADVHVEDAEQRAGPFAIGERNYTVVLHEKRLANVSGTGQAQTLAGMDIIDAAGNVFYRNAFSYPIEQGRFLHNLSASAQLASGKTGAGLIIHYREETAASLTSEFWQLFGLVNGKLAPLGKPAPIGEAVAGRPFMGVMMRAANGTVSVISQPDTIQLRAWTGNFYIFVPLRVDWNHGGLTQGQRCMEMLGGGLQEIGCDMRVEAVRKPPADEYTFARLFVEAREDMGIPEHVVMQKNSKIEILGARAITTWNENGKRIQPVFSDLWLHVRMDHRAGWIHGEEDFAAVGLPAGSPSP